MSYAQTHKQANRQTEITTLYIYRRCDSLSDEEIGKGSV